MKQLGPIAIVVGLLLMAALYYNNQKAPDQPGPTPPPNVAVATPVDSPPVQPTDGTPRSTDLSAGTLTLKSALSHPYLPQGQATEVYTSVGIEAVQAGKGHRAPLNVAIVIDRSGSMSGAPMHHARLAATKLVDLLDERDRLSIISYSRDATVDYSSSYVTHANRSGMIRAINRMQPSGATNISGGLELGTREVSRWKSKDSVNRVLLFTDGIPNVGLTRTDQLAALARNSFHGEGVSVTTMGFGISYNEDLMAAMATEGGGNYHYIAQPNVIAAVFETEIRGMSATVARNATVSLDLPDGVFVDEVFGFAHTRSGNRVQIPLAEFYSGQSRNILLKLRVPTTELAERPVLSVGLTYHDAVADKPAHQRNELVAVVTNDAAKVENQINADVMVRVQEIEMAQSVAEAMKYYDQGDLKKAEEVIQVRQERIRSNQAQYKLSKPKMEMLEGSLKETERQMRAAPARSAAGRNVVLENKAQSLDLMR